MALPRQPPPPARTERAGEVVADVGAAAGTGALAAALGVGAAAGAGGSVAGGGAVTAATPAGAAAISASAAVLAAFERFAWRRRRDFEGELLEGMREDLPDAPDELLLEAASEELERERGYAAKVRERLDRDLPRVFAILEAVTRRTELEKVLSREKRYQEQREDAIALRSLGLAEARIVRGESPDGALWKLSPFVHEHTLDCLAMGGKVWPWTVLEAYHPPLHHNCACELEGLRTAVDQGDLTDDFQIQTPDAAFAAMQMQEAAWDPDTLEQEMQLLEAWVAPVRSRRTRHWGKGHSKGGEFRPERGGTPGRPTVRGTRTRRPAVPATPVKSAGVNEETVKLNRDGKTADGYEVRKRGDDAYDVIRSDGQRVGRASKREGGPGSAKTIIALDRNRRGLPPDELGEDGAEAEPPKGTKTYRGTYYFDSYDAAREYARVNDLPTDRIVNYERGWAVQLRRSGPYAGPGEPGEGDDPKKKRGSQEYLNERVNYGGEIVTRGEMIADLQRIAKARGLSQAEVDRFVQGQARQAKPVDGPGRDRDRPAKSLEEVQARHPEVEIEASENADGIILSLIRTDERGRGAASAALDELLDYADAEGKVVAATPEPVGRGGLTKKGLTAWYAKRGFVKNTGRKKDYRFRETLIREPEERDDGTPEGDVTDVGGDVKRAAELLGQGKKVQLDQPKTASTLLDELAAQVKEAVEKGDAAPDFDLCKVSVPGTNLFCAESKGIPRVEMPQLKGVPAAGSKAADMEANDRGEVDLSEQFRAHLESKGFKVERGTERASYLRASQRELNGAKVSGMVSAMRAGTEIKGAPTFVSKDDYIVDGHHRWAAEVGMDAIDGTLGNDRDMDVDRIDADIITILDEANKFAADNGIPQAGVEQGVAPEPTGQDLPQPDELEQIVARGRNTPGPDETQLAPGIRFDPDATRKRREGDELVLGIGFFSMQKPEQRRVLYRHLGELMAEKLDDDDVTMTRGVAGHKALGSNPRKRIGEWYAASHLPAGAELRALHPDAFKMIDSLAESIGFPVAEPAELPEPDGDTPGGDDDEIRELTAHLLDVGESEILSKLGEAGFHMAGVGVEAPDGSYVFTTRNFERGLEGRISLVRAPDGLRTVSAVEFKRMPEGNRGAGIGTAEGLAGELLELGPYGSVEPVRRMRSDVEIQMTGQGYIEQTLAGNWQNYVHPDGRGIAVEYDYETKRVVNTRAFEPDEVEINRAKIVYVRQDPLNNLKPGDDFKDVVSRVMGGAGSWRQIASTTSPEIEGAEQLFTYENGHGADAEHVAVAVGPDNKVVAVGRPNRSNDGFAESGEYDRIREEKRKASEELRRATEEIAARRGANVLEAVREGDLSSELGSDPQDLIRLMQTELNFEARGNQRSSTRKGVRGATMKLRSPEGHTVDVFWAGGYGSRRLEEIKVKKPPKHKREMVEGRRPKNRMELEGDVLAFGDELTERHGAAQALATILHEGGGYGRSAHHEFVGTIVMNTKADHKRRVDDYLKDPEGATDAQRIQFYDSLQVLMHETHHGVGAADESTPNGMAFQPQHYSGGGKAWEEALTEETSHVTTIEWLKRHDMQDVLAAVKRDQDSSSVVGTYTNYRNRLKKLLEETSIDPSDYTDTLMRWKFERSPEDGMRELAEAIPAVGEQRADWSDVRRQMGTGSGRGELFDFARILPLPLDDVDDGTPDFQAGQVIELKPPPGTNDQEGPKVTIVEVSGSEIIIRTQSGAMRSMSPSRLLSSMANPPDRGTPSDPLPNGRQLLPGDDVQVTKTGEHLETIKVAGTVVQVSTKTPRTVKIRTEDGLELWYDVGARIE